MTDLRHHSRTAVVLAAHGSATHTSVARLAQRIAGQLVDRGHVDEASVTFLKQPPYLADALRTVTAEDVTVVPLFTSRGYYIREVLPREVGSDGTPPGTGERHVRFTSPIGESPRVAELTADHVAAALREHRLSPEDTGLVVVGHGTRRNPHSGSMTYRHADRLRGLTGLAEVVAVFLDQSPEIEQTFGLTCTANLLIAPFLMGGAGHEQVDVPRRLGMTVKDPQARRQPQHVGDRTVLLLPAFGEDPRLVDIIVEVARAAGAPLRHGDRPTGNETTTRQPDAT